MEDTQQPGGGMAGMGVKKAKFTVTVNGRKWSSARLESEMLREFLVTVQNNARRLDYISQDDSIQRLLLANDDGSEPEDLDFDATLGDVMICMGGKHLIAVVKSTTPTHPNAPPTATATATATDTATATATSGPVIANGQGSSLSSPNKAKVPARCSSHYSIAKVEQAEVDPSRHGHAVETGVAMAGLELSVDFGWSPPGLLPPVPVEDPHVVTYYPLDPHAREHHSRGHARGHQSLGQARGHQSPGQARGHQSPGQARGHQSPGHARGHQSPGQARGHRSPGQDPPVDVPVNAAPMSDGVDSGLPDGGDEPVYVVKQRRKEGGHVIPRELRISDVAPHLFRTIEEAAKELEVSTKTLKRAKTKLGLGYWHGRNVRNLKNVIAGVEHYLINDDGVTLEERRGLTKDLQQMQQELALELLHGTKHSSEVRAKWHKWLSERGWRSNDHISGGTHDTGPSGTDLEAEPDA